MVKPSKVNKIVIMSLLLGIALTIFIIESQIPIVLPIPGIKLGLSNIITLISLLYLGSKEAAIILYLRIIIGSIFSGQAISLMYSLAGGTICLIVMIILSKILKEEYIPLISIIGAVFHNIGQIIVAIFLINNSAIIYYLPLLMLSSIITGFFTGYIVYYINSKYSIIKDKTFR